MSEVRQEHLRRIALELETLRASIHQLKAEEDAGSELLPGNNTVNRRHALEHAFEDLRDSINHMEEVGAAVAEATGEV